MIYQVVFFRSGREMGKLYWNATLCEIEGLARSIALARNADNFQVIEVDGSGAEVYSEPRPFGAATNPVDGYTGVPMVIAHKIA